MKKMLLSAILATGCANLGYAQSATDVAPETGKSEKKFDHYFGVQLNDLLRQIISFNNTTAAANNNPYLLIYNINHHKTGWGLRVGLGATISSSATNDNITRRKSDINDYQVRLGIEKMFSLSGKWTCGVGLDGIMKSNDDKTIAITQTAGTQFKQTTETTSKVSSYGGGAMAWLRYNLTSRVILGTETSFYYTSGKNKQTIIFTDDSQVTPISETNTDNDATEGKIAVPVTFYITVKF